jgi:putative protein-disulfide isomerase
MSQPIREMYYIADPMCSWCYGFAQVIQGIHAQYQDRIKISLVTGGLRVGNEYPFTEKLKYTLVHHWREVEEMTKQTFNYDFTMPDGFIYNTEPSCRAAVVMRKHKGDEVFPFFETLHKAFYAECRDLTDPNTLAELAAQHDLDKDTFITSFQDPEVAQETYDDFAFGHSLGLQGFPSIVLKNTQGLALLTSGYQHYEDLTPIIDDWLTNSDTYDEAQR